MSYILDALKKSDQERNLGEVPDLETAHWRVRRQARPHLWIWVVAALLVFNGLLLAVMLGRDGPDKPADIARLEYENVAPESKLVIPVPRDPATLRPPVTTRPRVQSPPPVVHAPVRQEQKVPAQTQTQQTAPRVSQAEPVPATADEFKVPEWRELTMEFRSGFNLPRIDVHVYAEDPQRRFIMANLKKYREGETLDSGALLEKIHPGSIQLNYQGKRFRVDR
jgi:general secretion pathway protein B